MYKKNSSISNPKESGLEINNAKYIVFTPQSNKDYSISFSNNGNIMNYQNGVIVCRIKNREINTINAYFARRFFGDTWLGISSKTLKEKYPQIIASLTLLGIE